MSGVSAWRLAAEGDAVRRSYDRRSESSRRAARDGAFWSATAVIARTARTRAGACEGRAAVAWRRRWLGLICLVPYERLVNARSERVGIELDAVIRSLFISPLLPLSQCGS